VLRVPTAHGIGIVLLVEPLECVLPHRLEQRVARRRRTRLADNHRLGDEIRDRVDDVPRLDVVVGCDGGGRGGVERPGERAQTVEHDTFARIEE